MALSPGSYYFYNAPSYQLKWRDIARTVVDKFGKPDECFMVPTEFDASSKLDIDILNCDLYGKAYMSFNNNFYMMKKLGPPNTPRMRKTGEYFWNPIFLFNFGRIHKVEQVGNYIVTPSSKSQPYMKERGWTELSLVNPFERVAEAYGKLHRVSLNGDDPDEITIEVYNFILDNIRRNGMVTSGNEWVSSFFDN